MLPDFFDFSPILSSSFSACCWRLASCWPRFPPCCCCCWGERLWPCCCDLSAMVVLRVAPEDNVLGALSFLGRRASLRPFGATGLDVGDNRQVVGKVPPERVDEALHQRPAGPAVDAV